MKWQFKYMLDPGDGIVTTEVREYPTDDPARALQEFEKEQQYGWIFAVEALPE